MCRVFDTTTLTVDSEWNPLPRTTSGDSSAIQTFATPVAEPAGLATTSIAPRRTSALRIAGRWLLMVVRYPIRPRADQVYRRRRNEEGPPGGGPFHVGEP